MLKRRIHLHGPFKAFHDGPVEVAADTVWEAVEAMTRQLQGFLPDPIKGRKVLQVMGFNSEEDLKRFDTTTEDIHVFPALTFGKEGGMIQTIVGVALVVVGLALGGPANPWGLFYLSAGATLLIGSVIQALSPQPQLNASNEDQVRSKYLPGNQNTVGIGTTIPLLYGRHLVGGHILSLNIDAVDTGI